MICSNCFNETREGRFCSVCGFKHSDKRSEKALPEMHLLDGRYRLGRVLGLGGFGITYLAYDTMERRRVAIKECFPDSYCERRGENIVETFGNKDKFDYSKEKFVSEVNALYALRDITGVVNVFSCFEENNTYYYVMDFIDGVSLKYLVTKNGGKIPWENALYVCLILGSCISDLHNRSYIHRDISPENIMIDAQGNIYLIDFGTVVPMRNRSYEQAVFLKHGFAPPEQYELNGELGAYTDVYALAATYYTIVSGQPLVDSMTRKEIVDGGSPDIMKPLNRIEDCSVPDDISYIIERAMSLTVADRTRDVKELSDELGRYADYASPFDSDIMKCIETYTPQNIHTGDIKGRVTGERYPYVEILSGDKAGQIFKIHNYGFTLIGRDPSCAEIVINYPPEISRKHCMVGYDRAKDRFIIMDISSMGTYYSNGMRMLHNAESYIHENDTFMLYSSDVKIRVLLK